MDKLSISVSDELEAFVADRIKSGEFDDASAYVNELIRLDHAKREAKQKLRDIIDDARASGVSEKTFDEIWDAGAARGRAKAKAKRREA